jgi:hypothetical protein
MQSMPPNDNEEYKDDGRPIRPMMDNRSHRDDMYTERSGH